MSDLDFLNYLSEKQERESKRNDIKPQKNIDKNIQNENNVIDNGKQTSIAKHASLILEGVPELNSKQFKKFKKTRTRTGKKVSKMASYAKNLL